MLAEIVWNQQSLAVVMVFAIPLAAIIGGIWAKVATTESQNELKRSMVERGMSVEEIERVMAAGPARKSDLEQRQGRTV